MCRHILTASVLSQAACNVPTCSLRERAVPSNDGCQVSKGLSYDDLKALESQRAKEDSPALESPPVRVFTTERLAEAFQYFKKGMEILSKED